MATNEPLVMGQTLTVGKVYTIKNGPDPVEKQVSAEMVVAYRNGISVKELEEAIKAWKEIRRV